MKLVLGALMLSALALANVATVGFTVRAWTTGAPLPVQVGATVACGALLACACGVGAWMGRLCS